MMQEREGGSRAGDTWRETTSRALALLAPFSQVRLTLQLPPDAFDSTLYRNFPLRDDERLLAVIDCAKGKPDGFCALTTHRIYWPDGQEGSGGASPSGGEHDGFATVSVTASASMEGSGTGANQPANGHASHCRWVDYRSLPGDLGRTSASAGSDRLDLGGGRTLALRGADPRLIRALEHYLAIMGAGTRSGRFPTGQEWAGVTPARSTAVVPPVATPRRRIPPTDLLQFRRALDAATHHVVVTHIMVIGCVAAFAVMAISGVSIFRPSSTQLIGWGANDGARVMLRHEYWRLVTSVFVHGGLIHLAVNLWSLMVIGPLVERIYGRLAFAVIYLSAGIGGAIASAVTPPMRVSVGASGAICGALGALMAFLVVHRRTIPPSVLQVFRGNLLGIVAFMAVLGVVVPNIDQAAHLGGLGTGFVTGLLLSRPWPVVPSRWIAARRLAMTAVIAAGLTGITFAATWWGEASLPPARRLEDLLDQIKPPYDEFYSIDKAISGVVVVSDRDHDSAGGEGASRAVRELAGRGGANLDRFRHATTSDPELRAVSDALIRAQAGQIERLEALGRFLDTGDRASLPAVREADAATSRAIREFEQRHLAYLTRHGLPVVRRARKP